MVASAPRPVLFFSAHAVLVWRAPVRVLTFLAGGPDFGLGSLKSARPATLFARPPEAHAGPADLAQQRQAAAAGPVLPGPAASRDAVVLDVGDTMVYSGAAALFARDPPGRPAPIFYKTTGFLRSQWSRRRRCSARSRPFTRTWCVRAYARVRTPAPIPAKLFIFLLPPGRAGRGH